MNKDEIKFEMNELLCVLLLRAVQAQTVDKRTGIKHLRDAI